MLHRTRARAALELLAIACASPGCAAGSAEAPPVATLASTPQAAAAFESVRDAWSDADHTPAPELRAKVVRFLAAYPNDGLAPLARIGLAFAAMRENDLPTADAALAKTADVPNGTARELWTVAKARRLRMSGQAEAGLALLRPYAGKSVDPLARSLFEEELTLTAVATHRDYEAISYMDAWLRGSTPDEKPAAVAHVTAIVEGMPRDVLVGALQAMSSQRANLGYGKDIERVLAQHLVQIATTSGDAELARMLFAADPQAFSEAGEAGVALGELVTNPRGLNAVRGRMLGLLLPTDSPDLRDESADVLRGVMWALGLPRGSRTPSSAVQAPDADRGAPAPCATLEPAPDPTEPAPEDEVHLVTRDDAGHADRTEVSLDELAGEGAAIIVAGLDPQTSDRALHWSASHHVPVVVLVPPPDAGALPPEGFLLGEGRADVLAALAGAEPSLASDGAVPVTDASEVTSFVPEGGRFAGWSLAPPVSCDVPAARAGEARFPLGVWQEEKSRAWIASGSPDCSGDLVGELESAKMRGVVALALEGAAVLHGAPGLRVLTARAGIVPEVDPNDPREAEARRFSASLGGVGWWTALGRDAATLSRAALLGLPIDTVTEAGPVATRRAAARSALAAARARLWTTESGGLAPDHSLKRTVCAFEAPSASGAK